MRRRSPWLRWLPLVPLISCTEDPVQPGRKATPETSQDVVVNAPPGASVTRRVDVPPSMRSSPFNVARYLRVPPNFSISVYARIPNARFMAVAPNGDLLVSQPNQGTVKLIRPNGSGDPIVSTFVSGLRKPHDLVFHAIGGTTYLYISESHQINRYVYRPGDRTARGRQVVVSGLPFQGRADLQYNHELKNIALDRSHNLYVMLASSCDACVEDTRSDPKRGAIYRYGAAGGNRTLFAQGLRNAEGLAFVPGTSDLWVTVNQQNRIACPHNNGTCRYGEVVQSYVDNHPPEEFTRVRQGGNYGWPFCNPNPDSPSGLNNMPFELDYNTNRYGRVNCGNMDRVTKGIQAHSAALGLTFFQGTNVPTAYRQGAAIALHGSGFNLRSRRTGSKVIYFPWSGGPGGQIDLVRGWLVGETRWGRPVDVAVNAKGHIFISDDFSGTIYKLAYTP